MTRHGSDKGHRWHNYTTIYFVLFQKLRQQSLRIFELGLGTNNPELASSMGVNARPGASLRGWREFFPRAVVYGADIDCEILFEADRIKTFYCDQLDIVAIRNMWAQPDLRAAGMDIIIEDGLHTFEANISFLEGSLEHLRPGGFYVVEDISQKTIGRWLEVLETVYSRRFPNHDFTLVELPNSYNQDDNNLLIICRPYEYERLAEEVLLDTPLEGVPRSLAHPNDRPGDWTQQHRTEFSHAETMLGEVGAELNAVRLRLTTRTADPYSLSDRDAPGGRERISPSRKFRLCLC